MVSRTVRRLLTLSLAACLWLAPSTRAQPMDADALLRQFEEKITTFTLANGLDFVIIERHDAPVVSFHTYADVGSVNEPQGATGIAHMFEHMAFKGTTTIGTKDIEAELEALRREEELFLELRRERAQGAQADSARIQELEEEFGLANEDAKAFARQNEFDRLLQQAGATGLNASTFVDWTRYYYSLPANKLELFFVMESDRFLNPVLREFYQERDVVMEERRLRTESSPQGRLVEEFLSTAFKAHPYGNPTIGHMSDLENISRTEAKRFFDKYYNANNLTIAIAGDVQPEVARQLAEKYFGRLEKGPEPLPVTTEEPDQLGPRRVTLYEQSQPLVLIGYHRPSASHPDDPVYAVLQDVLSQGRTSRLYTSLVETEKALGVQVLEEFPGSKYPTLFGFFAAPNRGVSPDSLERDIYAELDRIKDEGITQEELERAQTRARANLIGELDSNTGLAYQLAGYQARTGDWRNFFRRLDELQAVTTNDVQRVARETFQRSNRTVAMVKSDASAAPQDVADTAN